MSSTVPAVSTPNGTADAPERCPCGNAIDSEGLTLCDYCDFAAEQPPHKFRTSLFGELWCVTCASNYCELA